MSSRRPTTAPATGAAAAPLKRVSFAFDLSELGKRLPQQQADTGVDPPHETFSEPESARSGGSETDMQDSDDENPPLARAQVQRDTWLDKKFNLDYDDETLLDQIGWEFSRSARTYKNRKTGQKTAKRYEVNQSIRLTICAQDLCALLYITQPTYTHALGLFEREQLRRAIAHLQECLQRLDGADAILQRRWIRARVHRGRLLRRGLVR